MIETQNFKLSPHIAACIPLVEEGDGGVCGRNMVESARYVWFLFKWFAGFALLPLRVLVRSVTTTHPRCPFSDVDLLHSKIANTCESCCLRRVCCVFARHVPLCQASIKIWFSKSPRRAPPTLHGSLARTTRGHHGLQTFPQQSHSPFCFEHTCRRLHQTK